MKKKVLIVMLLILSLTFAAQVLTTAQAVQPDPVINPHSPLWGFDCWWERVCSWELVNGELIWRCHWQFHCNFDGASASAEPLGASQTISTDVNIEINESGRPPMSGMVLGP